MEQQPHAQRWPRVGEPDETLCKHSVHVVQPKTKEGKSSLIQHMRKEEEKVMT